MRVIEKRERVTTSNNQPMKCKQHTLGCIGIGGCYLLLHQNCMKGGDKWVGYTMFYLFQQITNKLGNI